jgi:hypothetical protein
MLTEQHAQDHFHRRRGATVNEREAVALPQIRTYLLVQLIILEQCVQGLEHRISLGN